jgi:hypothetical protein
MQTLDLLTASQASDYIISLDLKEGTEAYRVLNAMLLLPQDSFLQAISALAQGLITFADIRALAAMNARLMGDLIARKMESDDPALLEWQYRTQFVPASIDLAALKTAAVGSVLDYLAARSTDTYGQILRPRYDFLGADQTAYFTYAEAYRGYMMTANGINCRAEVIGFIAAHNLLRATYPALLQASDDQCPVLQAVLSLQTEATFLERPTGGKSTSALVDWILSGTYRDVAPTPFQQYMDKVAFPTMAAYHVLDDEESGMIGAQALYAATPWRPVDATTFEQDLVNARMARVYLPQAYGTRVVSTAQLEVEKRLEGMLIAYLDAARHHITAFREALLLKFPVDASTVRTIPGTPIGMLGLTNS